MVVYYYFAAFLVTVIGGFVQLNRESDDQSRIFARLCPCFTVWQPLDVRWAFLGRTCAAVAYKLSWATLSAACSAVGGVLAWFFGYNYLRVPLDDYHFDQLIFNDAHFGCIQGPRALVPVYRWEGAEPDAPPEKWCPARARRMCAMIHWVDGRAAS